MPTPFNRNELNDLIAKYGGHDFFSAARVGLEDTVAEWILHEGYDGNEIDDHGFTAMFYAVRGKHITIVNELLNVMVNPNATIISDPANEYKYALPLACANHSIEIVSALLEAGANPDPAGSLPPLLIAASNGNTEMMHVLLDAGAKINGIDEFTHETALISAAENGFNHAVQLLIDKGADIKLLTTDGYSAILKAAENSYMNIVSLLLEAGADIRAVVPGTGQNALLLMANGDNADYFSDEAQLLLDRGLDVNSVDLKGNTALMGAVQTKNVEMIRFLINAGADSTMLNNDGKNALMLCDDVDTARVLTQAIASLDEDEVVSVSDADLIEGDENSIDDENLPPLEAATPIDEGDMNEVISVGIVHNHPDAINP